MAEIRQFAAIFGVFPRFSEFSREKKRPRHAKSVLGASGRASHHAKSDTWNERLFGNNYVAQKVMGRSIGRSLKKLRYVVFYSLVPVFMAIFRFFKCPYYKNS